MHALRISGHLLQLLPKSSLSEMPDRCSCQVVDGAAAGTAARGLLPPGFQCAAFVGATDLAEQKGAVPAPIRGQCENAARSRGRPQASRSRDRLLEHPAHLGTDLAAASTRSLCCAGRRFVPGPPTVDPVAAAILFAG